MFKYAIVSLINFLFFYLPYLKYTTIFYKLHLSPNLDNLGEKEIASALK